MKENVTALKTTENIYDINVKSPLAIVHKYKEKLNMSTQVRMELKVIKLKIGLEWESISLQTKQNKTTKKTLNPEQGPIQVEDLGASAWW